MKKTIALLLVLAMALTLCACGSRDISDPKNNPLYKKMAKKMDIDFLAQDVDEIDSEEESISVYLNNDQPLDYPCVFEQGNGTSLQLPMTYGDLCDAGWTLEYEEISDPFPADEVLWYTFVNADGKTIGASIWNMSDTPVDVREAAVHQLQFGDSYSEIFTVNGIGVGSTVQEVLDVFGMPSGCYYYEWKDGGDSFDFDYNSEDGKSSLSFFVDTKTNLMFGISYYQD